METLLNLKCTCKPKDKKSALALIGIQIALDCHYSIYCLVYVESWYVNCSVEIIWSVGSFIGNLYVSSEALILSYLY